jgi:hypothetical protein
MKVLPHLSITFKNIAKGIIKAVGLYEKKHIQRKEYSGKRRVAPETRAVREWGERDALTEDTTEMPAMDTQCLLRQRHKEADTTENAEREYNLRARAWLQW